MHHLAPAPAIPGLGEPAPPVRNGLLERGRGLLGWDRPVPAVTSRDALEHEGHRLTGREREVGEDSPLATIQLDRRSQREREIARVERRAVLADHGLVRLAPVVERRVALHAQAQAPAHTEDAAD